MRLRNRRTRSDDSYAREMQCWFVGCGLYEFSALCATAGAAGLVTRQGRTERQAGIHFETDDHPETTKTLLAIRTSVTIGGNVEHVRRRRCDDGRSHFHSQELDACKLSRN